MSEKRFTLEQWTEKSLYFSDGEFSAHMSIGYICKKVEKKLNEQQATINELKERNAHNFAQNIQLKKEIKELKEEEKLYAKEIVRLNKNIEELNKTIEEALKFKSLGGDY